MTVHTVRTEEDLDLILGRHETAVLDFWAPWCPPCRAFLPVFESAAERHPDLAFCRIDTQEAGPLADAFRIEHIPSLAVIRERVMITCHEGYLRDDELDDLLSQVRALDMEAVRREMEQAADAAPRPETAEEKEGSTPPGKGRSAEAGSPEAGSAEAGSAAPRSEEAEPAEAGSTEAGEGQ